MSLWDTVTRFFALSPMQDEPISTRAIDSFTDHPGLTEQLLAAQGLTARDWRPASVRDALGVPGIQRAVALITNTTGSLSMQGFRDGMPMPETPSVLARPDPFQTPRDAYWSMAYNMATRGETVSWIAKRDFDGKALSLVTVPLAELSVEENPRNRLYPIYSWGNLKSTRYSPANPDGDFVHVFYFKEPGSLRGVGPLQMCGAAVSVSVEAQEWAANFFAEGAGIPSITIQAVGELDATPDPDSGLNEADILRAAWMARGGNQPKVIDEGIKEIKEFGGNSQGSQMMGSRDYQNGDAARMFGVPGSLLDYSSPGGSLTYQNLEQEYTKFVRTCLAPNYLEPIEQAMSDLLSRSTVARFFVDGLLRADIKTRFEVYASGVTSGVLTLHEARAKEGLDPGDIEVAPVTPSAPQAIPTSLPQARSAEPVEVRCSGTYTVIRQGVKQERTCKRKLGTGLPGAAFHCFRCKRDEVVPAVEVVRLFAAPKAVAVGARAVEVPVERVAVPEPTEELVELRSLGRNLERLASTISRQDPPVVNFHEGAFHQDAPVVNIPAPVVNVPAPIVNIPAAEPIVPMIRQFGRDEAGHPVITRQAG